MEPGRRAPSPPHPDGAAGPAVGSGATPALTLLLPPAAGRPAGAVVPAAAAGMPPVAEQQGRQQQQEEDAAEASCGGEFARHCNLQRARIDGLVVGALMAIFCVGASKNRHALPPAAAWHLAVTLALTAVLVVWSHVRPGSYARWREFLAAFFRLAFTVTPVAETASLLVAGNLRQLAPRPGAAFIFLAGLLFASHAARLTILGLGLPARAAAHLPLQLAMLLAVRRQNPHICAALVRAGGGASAGAGGSGVAEATVAAASAVVTGGRGAQLAQQLHSVLALLCSLLLPHPLTLPPASLGPQQQCECLLGWFQLALGLLAPVAVQLVWESRAYITWRSQQGEQRHAASGSPPAAGAEQRQQRGSGADSDGQQVVGSPLLHRFYEYISEAANSSGWINKAGAALLTAAAAWEATCAFA